MYSFAPTHPVIVFSTSFTNNNESQLEMNRHHVVLSRNMRIIVLFHMYAWLLCFSQPCLAGDTLNAGQNITGNGILVSSGNKFELGFFSPLNVTGGKGRYLGMWYHRQEKSEALTVVWVANRDNPVAVDSTGVFQIAEDGNLVVVDTYGNNYWSSKMKGSSSTNRTVKLMDSGNLVLLDGMKKVWESFEHPTDTFLPGMKMDRNLKLTSWRNLTDPGSGNFTFKMEQTGDNRFIILNHDQLYWESEEQGILNSVAKSDDDMSTEVYILLTNFTIAQSTNLILENYENTRLLLNYTGMIQFMVRDNFQGDSVRWFQPKTKCLIYNDCGNFTSCNDNDKVCKCLPGFTDENNYTGVGDSSLICTRKSASCGKDTTRFLNLVMMKIRRPDKKVTAENETDCQSKCLEMCPQCQAYSYAKPTLQRGAFPTTCWIWTQDLTTLKEEYIGGDGRKLFLRVDESDIAPTPRTCEPCGTNTVPYPLSTGPSCGDPAYFKFSCSSSTGELSFTTTNNESYRVTLVDAVSRNFIIRVTQDEGNSYNRYCGENKDKNLEVSSPFDMTNDTACSDLVQVNWQLPSEPTCAQSSDCQGWKHSTCKGNRLSLQCKLSLAWRSFKLYRKRKIAAKLKQEGESIQRKRGRYYDSERQVKDLIDLEGLEEKDNEGIEVPYFDFESILVATDYFSDANKLGKGGYGPVYKGRLEGGQDIAVKRLSSVSSQGLQEFKNETEASTERVVGTYGYMSPEYALDGHFSTKSDVFSFGVMLLEIISGKKNTGFYQSKAISSLLGYAWRLWTENKLLDLVDLSLRETYNANQFIKCAHIGLLCVQDEPNDRPNMSNVVIMLDSETATLPTPKQPTFFTRKDLSSTASSSLQLESSIQDGR
ncbi:Wall-associated receptor kinase, galacturonan-binding domain [Sesbania bispinosa]|nr:Wall-associated receptor kinase, galacturonan-binding domain [Sesbania bispinosa]